MSKFDFDPSLTFLCAVRRTLVFIIVAGSYNQSLCKNEMHKIGSLINSRKCSSAGYPLLDKLCLVCALLQLRASIYCQQKLNICGLEINAYSIDGPKLRLGVWLPLDL